MKKLGLIGYPLSHSFSKPYFEEKFRKLGLNNYSFDTFPFKTIEEFPALIQKEKDLIGLSVTIPHKETVIPFLDELDETAEAIGAVNCIKISNGPEGIKKMKGYNTDAFGFKQSLRPFLDTNHTKALVFGTGGAAKAIAYVLKNLGIDFWYVSRKKNDSISNLLIYDELNGQIINSCKLLINCTPVGMEFTKEKLLPIPYSAITPEHLAYDLIYNPEETLFLTKASEQGALVSNGYNMLCFQADESWRIWNE